MNEITSITQQAKDKTRCNIYIDGRFCCGLRMDTAVKNRLKAGTVITPERLAALQMESEKNTAFDKALAHLSATKKTEKEMRDFLAKKGYLPVVVDYAVGKLREYGFIDDDDYAEAYLEAAAKRKGARLIRMELKNKGVSAEAIENALENLDEDTELSSAKEVAKKYLRGKTLDRVTLQKAYRYLMGKGFSFELAKEALSTFADLGED